jgi:hypothetical protein
MLEKIRIVDYGKARGALVNKNILLSLGFSVFLFLITLVLYLNFSYMGARLKEVEEIIFNNFKLLLFWINLKILLAYLVIGLVIGIFSLLLKIEKKRYILLFNFLSWFLFWARAVKSFPQLFSDQLFRNNGLPKYFQILITDFVPYWLIYFVFIAVIAVVSIVKKRVWASIVIVGVCALFIVKFDVPPLKEPGDRGGQSQAYPNILVVADDSLRSQSLSYHGYHRKTPNIDYLFSKGVSFLNARASLARTLPSWTSVFTSTFPPDHGLRHMFPRGEQLEKDRATVIDILNRQGYFTAVVSDFAGDIFPGIDYGFQEIVSPRLLIPDALKQRSLEFHYFLLGFLINPTGRVFFPEIGGMTLVKDPAYLTGHAKTFMKRAAKNNQPFFILYFGSNNHFPYVTRYPYYKKYIPAGYNGKHKYQLSSDVLESFLEAEVAKEEIPYVVGHYDNATSDFDDTVGDLTAFLRRSGIDRNTIVIIMSDHGENLYEEDYGIAHGEHLMGPYANSMVLGIYSPYENFKGLKIGKTVRDIDVAPTLLDLLKLPIPGTFRGHSLLPVMRGGDFPGYPAYMETGLWYYDKAPFIRDRIRVPYPSILQLLGFEMPGGRISLKEEYDDVMIGGKYRALELNEKKYVFMPGETEYKEFFFINDQPVDRESITDEEFLGFKEKMVEMFKDKFFIDENGFIREYKAGETAPRPEVPLDGPLPEGR